MAACINVFVIAMAFIIAFFSNAEAGDNPAQDYADCRDWIKKYNVVKDKSWGTLPLRFIK